MTSIQERLLENDPLRRGRVPCAVAGFAGEGERALCGELRFYDTPVGVVMTAELYGLEQGTEAVTPYRLCVGSRRSKDALALPLLYAKGGRIWARAVTGRLDLREITRHPVLLCTADRDTPRVLGRAGWRTRAVI